MFGDNQIRVRAICSLDSTTRPLSCLRAVARWATSETRGQNWIFRQFRNFGVKESPRNTVLGPLDKTYVLMCKYHEAKFYSCQWHLKSSCVAYGLEYDEKSYKFRTHRQTTNFYWCQLPKGTYVLLGDWKRCFESIVSSWNSLIINFESYQTWWYSCDSSRGKQWMI